MGCDEGGILSISTSSSPFAVHLILFTLAVLGHQGRFGKANHLNEGIQ